MEPGDLWTFRSPPETWAQLCGRAGIAVVRGGAILPHMVTHDELNDRLTTKGAAHDEPIRAPMARRPGPAGPPVRDPGDAGLPGEGKQVVLISGDEEYRSEEALPQLAKILAKHHGFACTVLFAVGKDGTIDPNRQDNIPGLEALRKADLMIIATRFRDLPDDQMKEIVDYVESGRPVIGLRTATHAFSIKGGKKAYSRYSFNSKEWDGGFGRQVLGETWVNHHGNHGVEGTRGIIAPGAEGHPILRGIKDGDITGPTDVYTVRLPLPGDSKPAGPRPGRRRPDPRPASRSRARRTTR